MTKISQNISPTINLTGYRLLFLLQLLMQGPVSKEDIIEKVKGNEYIKEISPDTIRLDINTLKHAGFEIENVADGNKYIYILTSNPLEIKLSKENVKTINKIKKIALELWSWEDIISLYETLEKITHFINDEEIKNSILDFGYFMQVDFSLLKELNKYCLNNSEITVKYDSPKNGVMHIRLRALWIEHDKNTNKLHLLCQFEHYKYISYLRVDKIICVEQIFLKPTIELIDKKYKIYKIKNVQDFEPTFNEEIIEENEKYLTIKTTVVNDFQYIQRIILLGDKVIEIDKETKVQILENLLKTHEVYK